MPNDAQDHGKHSGSQRRRFLDVLPRPADGFTQRVRKAIDILLTSGSKELFRRLLQHWFPLHAAMRAAARITTSSPAPTVSIIVPAHNGLPYTQQCIRSFFDSNERTTFEVIVVDNGSSDGTSPWLRQARKRYPSLHHIRNLSNLGFPRAVNQAARVAYGEYLIIANNDIIVTPGWLDGLVATAESRPEVAIVSPVTNYVGEGPQVDPGSALLKASDAPAYAEALQRDHKLPFQVPDRLVFFCVLVRRHVFELLGGLSEVFGLGNFEDDDFCLRARLAGFSLVIDPRVFVFHYGGRTFAEQHVNHKKLMGRNFHRFFNRVAAFSVQPLPARARQGALSIASVVVRTVNRPHLLRDALTSLANQTFRAFEVVVVNDAGGDVSPILSEFADRLTIRHIRHSSQRGRSAALNSGAQAASGDWITYVDDDDIVYPTHLEVLVDALRRSPHYRAAYTDAKQSLSLALGGEERVVVREPRKSFEFDPTELLIQNHIPILTLIHARSCFGEIGFFNEELQELEDWDFIIRLAQVTPFLHVRRITCEYRPQVSREILADLLARRRSMMELTRQIYFKYQVKDRALEERRSASVKAQERELKDLAKIMAMPYAEEKKAILSAARIYAPSSSDTLTDIDAPFAE